MLAALASRPFASLCFFSNSAAKVVEKKDKAKDALGFFALLAF
jgi:hypothetical protein